MAGYGRRPCLTPDTIWVQSHSIWKKRKHLHKIRHIGSALIDGSVRPTGVLRLWYLLAHPLCRSGKA